MKLAEKLIQSYRQSQNSKKELIDAKHRAKLLFKYKTDLENEINEKKLEKKRTEYQKFKRYQEMMFEKNGTTIKFEQVNKVQICDPNIEIELFELKLKLEETTFKANASFEEWDYLKSKLQIASMEDIYGKTT